MKRFFEYKLSPRRVILPILGMFVVALLSSTLCTLTVTQIDPSTGTIVDAHLGGVWLLSMLVAWATMVALCALLYPLTTETLQAAGFEGEKLQTDYNFGSYLKLSAIGSLLTILTAGIYAPWFCVRLTRYFCEGASWRMRPFGFHAKGMGLFVIITLVLLLPSVVLGIISALLFGGTGDATTLTPTLALGALVGYILATLWMGLLCVTVTRWMVDLSNGSQRITCDAPIGRSTLFVAGQLLLTLLTLGLYAPMMELRTMQYFARYTRIGDQEKAPRLGMHLRPWRDWAYLWLHALLVALTLGLYLPWYYTRILNRFIPRLYVND